MLAITDYRRSHIWPALLCAGATGVGVLGCETGSGPEGAADGAALYGKHCTACHGPGAMGIDQVGPPVRFVVRSYGQHVVRAGRDDLEEYAIGMPPFDSSRLGDDDLDAVLDFLHDFERPTDGPTRYRVFCANCHGADGLGGRAEAPLRGAGAPASGFLSQVRAGDGDDPGDPLGYMPAWTEGDLSDADVASIESYVRGLESVR